MVCSVVWDAPIVVINMGSDNDKYGSSTKINKYYVLTTVYRWAGRKEPDSGEKWYIEQK